MTEKLEIIEELGSGGFATTFKARIIDQDLLNEVDGFEVVAMKVPHRYDQATLKYEIINNARLLMQLKNTSSPNLVRYLTFDTFMNKVVMLMEFVPGSLRGLIGPMRSQNASPKPALPFGKSITIMTGILQGLVFIHSEGLFHRDIKPENILIEGDIPKICDLGVSAVLASANSQAKTTAGTWQYMAPEVMHGTGASFPADVWSTGVLFYELLTGKLPFGLGFDTPKTQIIDRIREDDPLPPSHYVDLPAEIDRIVLKALEKDPQQRIPSAAAFLQELSQPQEQPEESTGQTLKDLRHLLETGAQLREIVKQADKLRPQYPDSCEIDEFLGEVYIRYQHYHDAIDTLEGAVARGDENPMCYWNLTIAYERTNQFKKAYKAITRAMRIGLEPDLQRLGANWRRIIREKGELSSSYNSTKNR